MTPGPSFLDALKHASEQADKAEDEFRRSITTRIKEFERERAFAHRRLNLMRAVSETVAGAESEEIAVASATAVLRARLGWSSDSDARTEVLSRFAPVAQAIFVSLAPDEAETTPPDVIASLAEFEKWYAETHPNPFWVLFEHYMPETPLVDF
jgi:hypothetical protein